MLHSFLSSLRMQKEAEVWQYQGSVKTVEPQVVKTEVAVMIAQRNLIAMLENLPAAVAAVEATIAEQKAQAERFKKSQE